METKGKPKWTKSGMNNYVLVGKGFYLSYNPDTSIEHDFFTDLGNMMGGNLKDGEETALYNRETGKWYILECDFRKEYTKAFPNYGECKRVYMKNKNKNRSNWSTD